VTDVRLLPESVCPEISTLVGQAELVPNNSDEPRDVNKSRLKVGGIVSVRKLTLACSLHGGIAAHRNPSAAVGPLASREPEAIYSNRYGYIALWIGL
jgi:hypothetical protein